MDVSPREEVPTVARRREATPGAGMSGKDSRHTTPRCQALGDVADEAPGQHTAGGSRAS